MSAAQNPSPQTDISSPPHWWRDVLAQVVGLGAAAILGALWSFAFGAGMSTPLWTLLLSLCCGAMAAVLGLGWWRLLLNLGFAPALATGMAVSLPPQWSAAAFIFLLLVYGGTQRTRVPLYLSNRAALRALRELVPSDRPLSFLDVGAGTGTVLAALSCGHANVTVHGVECAILPFLVAFLRANISGRHYRVRWGNLWSADLSGHDIVYAYLSPAPMPSLWEKACREMRPGSLLVSFRFTIPGVVPTRTIGAGGANCLYVWRLP